MLAEKNRRCLQLVLILLAVIVTAPRQLFAAVKLHPLFSDGAVLQRDMKVPIWGWADDGEKVTVQVGNQEKSAAAKDGKWSMTLDAMEAGGPHVLTVSSGGQTIEVKDVLVGEVWLASGQSNMQWPISRTANAEAVIAAAANPSIRLLTVPRRGANEPQSTVEANWTACSPDSVKEFSAVAYYFGRELQKVLGVPVGLINTSYGGTPAEAWTSRGQLAAKPQLAGMLEDDARTIANLPETQKRFEDELAKWKEEEKLAKEQGKEPPRRPQPPAGENSPHRPSVLHNAMIAPLVPYAVRGAIWYQGESNAGRAYQYRTLFPAMIEDWRHAWGQDDFPFLFVQLAPFMKITSEPAESAWAELRDAQLQTSLTLPKTAMAVITDVGDEADIHPQQKEPVGLRLALAARALAYGEKIEYSGPVLKRQEIRKDRIVLSFDHVGDGLAVKGDSLTGFTIAGKDRRWVSAYAEVQGDQVAVWTPEVPEPVAVRYGWANYPLGNLWNKSGLPASPFRTDDFPLTTMPQAAGAGGAQGL